MVWGFKKFMWLLKFKTYQLYRNFQPFKAFGKEQKVVRELQKNTKNIWLI